MIRPQDIRDRAAEWQLRQDIVEKDYVLGWLLAALGSHPVTSGTWIFKGGTCLKKCYVETYRFSEDLDFSLLQECPYTQEALSEILGSVARTAGELSGIDFPRERVELRPRQDKLGRPTFEARVYYRGPLGIPSYPRVLFDLTQHEPVLDVPSRRPILHSYPDALPDGLAVSTYSLAELLAEKVRALYERTRPRDLYDVVYLLENQPETLDLPHVHDLFAAKCAAKKLPTPSASELLKIIQESEELRSEWANMLAYQVPTLPEVDDLLGRLPDLLAWIDVPAAVPSVAQLAHVPSARGESLVAPAGIQYWGGGTSLEALRFAGSNRLLVEFTYDGRRRRAEPYSLRRAQTGNLLFYGWEAGSTHIKAFNTAKMIDVRSTNVSFSPRYRIEFSPSGPVSAPQASVASQGSFKVSRRPRRQLGPRRPTYGPTYVFECSYCQKRFRHSRNDPTLRKHKMKDGHWDCPGRRGYLVSVE
jgi:predicted nucleotidyltransferase component of viral defense system